MPGVWRVATNIPTPWVSTVFMGNTACGSVLVRRRFPSKSAPTTLFGSSAKTLMETGTPATAAAGAVIARLLLPKTQVAPTPLVNPGALSVGEPSIRVLPSAAIATAAPCSEVFVAPVPTKGSPSCVQTPDVRFKIQIAR